MKFPDFVRDTVDFIGFAAGMIAMLWFGLAIAMMLE